MCFEDGRDNKVSNLTPPRRHTKSAGCRSRFGLLFVTSKALGGAGVVPIQRLGRGRSAVAARLADIATRAAEGRRLTAQAQALRCALPCLTRVEWQPHGSLLH